MGFAQLEQDTEFKKEIPNSHGNIERENSSVHSALTEASTMGNSRMIKTLEAIEDQDSGQTQVDETPQKTGILNWGKQKATSVKKYFQQTVQRFGNYLEERKAKKQAKKRLSDINVEMLAESSALTSDERTEATDRLKALRQTDNEQAERAGETQESRFNKLEAGGFAFLIEDQKYNENGEVETEEIQPEAVSVTGTPVAGEGSEESGDLILEDKKYKLDEQGLIVEDMDQSVPAIDEDLITNARQDFLSKTPVRKKISNFFGVGTTILDGLARTTKKKLKKEKKATTAIGDFIYKDFLHISNSTVSINDDNTDKNMEISSKNITILGQAGANNNVDRVKLKTGLINIKYDAMKDSFSAALSGGTIEKAPLSFLTITAQGLELVNEGNNITADKFTIMMNDTKIETTNPLEVKGVKTTLKNLDISNAGVSWNSETISATGQLIDTTTAITGDIIIAEKEKAQSAAANLQIKTIKINFSDISTIFEIPSSAAMFQKTITGWGLKDKSIITNTKELKLYNFLNVKEVGYSLSTDYSQEITAKIDEEKNNRANDNVQITKLEGALNYNYEGAIWNATINKGKLQFGCTGIFDGNAENLKVSDNNSITADKFTATIHETKIDTTNPLEMSEMKPTLKNLNVSNEGVSWNSETISATGELTDKSSIFRGKLIIAEKQKNQSAAANLQIQMINLKDMIVFFRMSGSVSMFQKTETGWSLNNESLTSNAKVLKLFNYLELKDAVYTLDADCTQKITAAIDDAKYTGKSIDHLNVTKFQGGLNLHKEGTDWSTTIDSGEYKFECPEFFTGTAKDINFDTRNRLVVTDSTVTLEDKDVKTPAPLKIENLQMDGSGINWSANSKKVLLPQFRDLILFEIADLKINKNVGEKVTGTIDYTNVIPNIGILDRITISSKGQIERHDKGWDTSSLAGSSEKKISLNFFSGKTTISGLGFSLGEKNVIIQGTGNLESGTTTEKNIGSATVLLEKDEKGVTNEFQDVNLVLGNLALKLGKGSYKESEGYVFENVTAGLLSRSSANYDPRIGEIANDDLGQRLSDFNLHGFGIQVSKFSISSKGPKIEKYKFVTEKLEFKYGKKLKVLYDLKTKTGYCDFKDRVNKTYVDASIPLIGFPPGLASIDLGFSIMGNLNYGGRIDVWKNPGEDKILQAKLSTQVTVSPSLQIYLGLHLGPKGVAELALQGYGREQLNLDASSEIEKGFNIGEKEFTSLNDNNFKAKLHMGAGVSFVIGARALVKSLLINKCLYDYEFKRWNFGEMGFDCTYSGGRISFSPYVGEQGNTKKVKKDGGGLTEFLKNAKDLYQMFLDIKEEKNQSKIKEHMLDSNQWIINSSGEFDEQGNKVKQDDKDTFPTRKKIIKEASSRKKSLSSDKKVLNSMLKSNTKTISAEIIKKRPLVMGRIIKHTLRTENAFHLLQATNEQASATTTQVDNHSQKGLSIVGENTLSLDQIAVKFGTNISEKDIKKLEKKKAGIAKEMRSNQGKNITGVSEGKKAKIERDSARLIREYVSHDDAIINIGRRKTAFEALKSADHSLKTSGALDVHRPDILENIDSVLTATQNLDVANVANEGAIYSLVEQDTTTLDRLVEYRRNMENVFANEDAATLLEGLAGNDLEELYSKKSKKAGESRTKQADQKEYYLAKISSNAADGRGGFREVNKYDFERTQYYMEKLQLSNRVVIRKTNKITENEKMVTDIDQLIAQYEGFITNTKALDKGMPANVETDKNKELKLLQEKDQQIAEETIVKDKTTELLNHLEDMANDKTDEMKDFPEVDEYTKEIESQQEIIQKEEEEGEPKSDEPLPDGIDWNELPRGY
ncbi:hypothetical protein [Desulfuribacillus alkaliarsenatis]|uniref:Uncharacterized protein n=1 Tax=Desulfuribacillus alkaliarsenatis TaxID=766136 RepID=A0A1E5G2J2_9FIRM|nr:hypothetical protein [Desulfuribacillus alkaliarsenatis]OEF97107.1 hypothetical protein BHF68_05790 [Desulfuribacillus alkaliarsenatis]